MNNQTILIVDDTVSNIDILIDMLLEYDVVDALNASDALEILEETRVDLILLDIVMPVMDGYEMCRVLKNNPKTAMIPVIFLSSNNSTEDVQKGFGLGAVDYVTKPFNRLELISRIKTHLELYEYRENLEKKIKKEISKSQEKDKILFHQSKLVSMGEMIANIAHQWKQPLTVLNIINATLKEKNKRDKLSKDELNSSLDDMEVNIMQMAQTVEDFLSYFSPNKLKEKFSVLQSINKATLIIDNAIKKEDVNIFIKVDETFVIQGYKEEFVQVLITILMNSIQALNKIDSKEIHINASKDKEIIFLEISDNAGGISEEFLGRVFEPYFTTKHQTQGTGLGLYIAKIIIENSMDGTLIAKNTDIGAKFIISI